jgi:4-hydroxy-tetrahydrodipicolinate synthase
MPAITTPFNADLGVDHGFLAEHSRWMLDNGCTALVALGSLGEGATLSADEKAAVLKTCLQAADGAPIIAAISALATADRRPRWQGAGRELWLPGADGAAPVRRCRGRGRDGGARLRRGRRDAASLHALTTTPSLTAPISAPNGWRRWRRATAISQAVQESSTDVRRITRHPRAHAATASSISVGVDDAHRRGIARRPSAGSRGWSTPFRWNRWRSSMRAQNRATRPRRPRSTAGFLASAAHGHRAQVRAAHQTRAA